MKAWHWILGLAITFSLLFWGWHNIVWSELNLDGHTTGALIEKVEQATIRADWTTAQMAAGELQRRWEAKRFWFQVNHAELDFSTFETALGHIVGGVQAQNRASVLENTSSAQLLLANMASIMPRP